MEIGSFIETTLKEIAKGVNAASSESLGQSKYRLSHTGVDFDLAVSISTENKKGSEKGVGGKIKVVGLEYDFTKSETRKNECVSRVKFNVEFAEQNEGRVIRPKDSTLSSLC